MGPQRVPAPASPWREVAAVLAAALGVLSLLALLSYRASDVSLNASGTPEVHNLIGPVGAYWADVWLQLLGLAGLSGGPRPAWAQLGASCGARRCSPAYAPASVCWACSLVWAP